MAKSVAKKSAAPVAKKSAKSAKSTNKAVVVKAPTKETKKPNEFHDALIALMTRKDGATIQDFQGVPGFSIPSMAALRIAERAGFKTSAVKKPGERTVYKAVKVASS